MLARSASSVRMESIPKFNLKRSENSQAGHSYVAAKRDMMPSVTHCHDQYASNRVEASHEPPLEQERRMRGFRSHGHAQRFLSARGQVNNLFRLGRHLLSKDLSRATRACIPDLVGGDVRPVNDGRSSFSVRARLIQQPDKTEFSPRVFNRKQRGITFLIYLSFAFDEDLG